MNLINIRKPDSVKKRGKGEAGKVQQKVVWAEVKREATGNEFTLT